MNLSSFPARQLLAKILLLPLVYYVLQTICQNISVDTSRFTNWWSDFFPLPLPLQNVILEFLYVCFDCRKTLCRVTHFCASTGGG